MKRFRTVWAVLPAFVLSFCPASGQGLSPLQPRWQLAPSPERSPAWLMALWGLEPYAELQAVGFPLPPTPAEVAALPALTRMAEQRALKAVWLERLLRSLEERHRVSRENVARSALLGQRLGAPALFVEMLRRQASATLKNRERHLLESAQMELLSSYGVDVHDMRFFVESCGLSPAQLRDEVAGWLPLPALFNLPPAAEETPPSRQELEGAYVELLVARRELVNAWKSVVDRASADAAAEALLPALVRYQSALPPFFVASEELRSQVYAAYSLYAAPVNEACTRERARLQAKGFFGSSRLQVLDALFR